MNKNGQSIVEYVLIVTLVVLGIVFMGDYVLRSVNGHFKLWDEGVQDSFEENLTQAPVNDVPVINATCSCTQTSTCGTSGAGSLCAPNQAEIQYECNPQGCNGGSGQPVCVDDPSCCTTLTPIGCGNYPLNDSPPPPAGNCFYGWQISQQLCGSNPTYSCTQDPQCPMPICEGYIEYPNSVTFCATGTSSPPSFTTTPPTAPPPYQNEPITYINGSGSCSPDPSGCEVYCNPGYVLNSTKTACVIPGVAGSFVTLEDLSQNNCVYQFYDYSQSTDVQGDATCSGGGSIPLCGCQCGAGDTMQEIFDYMSQVENPTGDVYRYRHYLCFSSNQGS